MARWLRIAVTVALSSVTWSVGCGRSASSGRCGWEGWAGTCSLRSVTKVREMEFPAPSVVLEAIYSPKNDPGQQAPPEVRQEFKVLAQQELAMQEFLTKNGTVHCHVEPGADNACTSVRVALELPPFTPPEASAQTPQPQATNCSELEHPTEGTQLPPPLPGSQFGMKDEFFFEQNSVEVNSQMIEQAQAAARVLRDNPTISCLGVVGSVTYGESPSLAAQRGQTIQNFFLGAGIDPKRLTVFTATVRVYGAGATLPAADPKERKVQLRVMLYKPAGR